MPSETPSHATNSTTPNPCDRRPRQPAGDRCCKSGPAPIPIAVYDRTPPGALRCRPCSAIVGGLGDPAVSFQSLPDMEGEQKSRWWRQFFHAAMLTLLTLHRRLFFIPPVNLFASLHSFWLSGEPSVPYTTHLEFFISSLSPSFKLTHPTGHFCRAQPPS
jgi:hypothetical protein